MPGGLVAPRFGALDKAMAIEHGMDGALGGDADVAGEALTRSSRILRAPQCGFSRLRRDDQALDLGGSWLA